MLYNLKKGGDKMEKPYTYESSTLYFKHEISKTPICETYSNHSHNLYELLYILNGDVTNVIEDRKHKLKKGDLVLIRPSKYHFIQIDSDVDYDRYDILFDEKAFDIDVISKIPEGIEVINLSKNTIAKDIFQKMDYYDSRLKKEEFASVLSLLIKELFWNLGIECKGIENDYSVVNPLLSEALKYINDNLFTLRSIEEIASSLFITESYLFQLFQRELKNSPKRYINAKRLLHAQNLLQIGKKASKIYSDCGFGDYTSFYRSYVKFFGHPPSFDELGGHNR